MELPLVRPDDILAQPTRARLFTLLSELKRHAGTHELAKRLKLHPNGVRTHLELLEQAGLVTRNKASHGRGRPSDAWAIAAEARPGGEPPHAYEDLGRWLARATEPRPGRLREIEASGRQIGQELVPPESNKGGIGGLGPMLAALGFQPVVSDDSDNHTVFCLRNCPYLDAVRENPEVVCALHRGMTRGLLDVLEPHAELTGFVPKDPGKAGCLVEVNKTGSSTTKAISAGNKRR